MEKAKRKIAKSQKGGARVKLSGTDRDICDKFSVKRKRPIS